MELRKSNTDQEFITEPASLSEPHFDEEATLLTAQPVVPLQAVKHKERFKRRIVFAVVVVAALAIGALGGSLVFRGWVDNDNFAELSSGAAGFETPDPNAENLVEAEPVLTEPSPDPIEEIEESEPQKPDLSERAESRPRSVSKPDRSEKDDSEDDSVGPEPAEYDPELRRAQRRAERREERRLKRGKRARTSDDVSRIREIFEGPPQL